MPLPHDLDKALRDCADQEPAGLVCRFQEKADHIPVLEGNRGMLREDVEVFASSRKPTSIVICGHPIIAVGA
jgi:hypothetical protein